MGNTTGMEDIDNTKIKAALASLIEQVKALETALRVRTYEIESYNDQIIKLKSVILECQEKLGINYHTSAEIARLKEEIRRHQQIIRKLQNK